MTIVLNHRQFTLAEYHQMIATGVLPAGDRVELIDGDVLDMAAIGSKRAAAFGKQGLKELKLLLKTCS